MGESKEMRDLVERLVDEVLGKHFAGIREDLVSRTCEELKSLKPGKAEKVPAEETPPGGAPTDLLNAALSSVQDSTSQTDILGALLEGTSKFAERSALFVVRAGAGSGWRARGTNNDDAIKAVTIDINRGLAARAYQDRVPAAAAAAEFDSGFLSKFGSPADGTNVLVLPLVVRDKVAALVYADAGAGPGKFDPSALECLVRTTGLWLELLAARKSGGVAEAPASAMAAAAPAPRAPEPEPEPPPPPPPPPKPVAAPPPPPPPVAESAADLSPEDAEVHKKAKRFAKLLVDEIKLYNKGKVEEGRKKKDLFGRLKEDIEKSRATYDKRYGQTSAAQGDYFTQELIRNLANNDPDLLGGDFSR